ncbi:MAG: nitroreductase family protein [Elusimicrobiota bacterium]|jgi:nitroreductase
MDTLRAIAERHSTRLYLPKPVPRATLSKIVDAGRRAATARNIQPWEFVVVTGAGLRARIADVTEYGKFIRRAPACVAVLTAADAKYFLEDGSAATENILVAAASLKVQSCWVAGDKKPYAPEIVRLLGADPARYRLLSLIALGYAGKEGRRVPKRPLASVLHWERFGGK